MGGRQCQSALKDVISEEERTASFFIDYPDQQVCKILGKERVRSVCLLRRCIFSVRIFTHIVKGIPKSKGRINKGKN